MEISRGPIDSDEKDGLTAWEKSPYRSRQIESWTRLSWMDELGDVFASLARCRHCHGCGKSLGLDVRCWWARHMAWMNTR